MHFRDHRLDSAFITTLVTSIELVRRLFSEVHPGQTWPSQFEEIVDLFVELRSTINVERPKQPDNFEVLFNLVSEEVNFREGNDNAKSALYSLRVAQRNFSSFDLFRFKEFVLDVIAQFSTNKPDLELLANFTNRLISKGPVRHYTLNYDSLFHDVLNTIESQDSNFSISREVNQGTQYWSRNGSIQAEWVFGPSEVDKYPPHCFFHLHGAVTYRSKPPNVWLDSSKRPFSTPLGLELQREIHQEVEATSSLEIENLVKSEMSFITGMNKADQIMIYPYSAMYQSFVRDYQICDELIIIGYAFNDPHVNAALSFNNRNLKKVTIVDYWPPGLTDVEDIDRFKIFIDHLSRQTNVLGTDPNRIGAFEWNISPPRDRIKHSPELHENIPEDVTRWEYDFNGTREYIDRILSAHG